MAMMEHGSAEFLVCGGGKFEFGEREMDRRRSTAFGPRTSIGILSYKPCQGLSLKGPYSPHDRVLALRYDKSHYVLQVWRHQCH